MNRYAIAGVAFGGIAGVAALCIGSIAFHINNDDTESAGVIQEDRLGLDRLTEVDIPLSDGRTVVCVGSTALSSKSMLSCDWENAK
jgi:hypothetical protein